MVSGSKVEVELFFPLSRAVDRRTTGRIRLVEEITPDESLGSLLTRLVQRYHGLQDIFDVERQRLNVYAMVVLNNTVMASSELLDTVLNDGDEVSILPQHVGGQGLVVPDHCRPGTSSHIPILRVVTWDAENAVLAGGSKLAGARGEGYRVSSD